MEHSVVERFLNLRLTKEEEEEISITTKSRVDLLEECSLSYFGRLLTDRHQSQRALKNTLRSAWKMRSDLQIVEVGNKILQFKFNSEFQLQWVERNGLWNFENNLLPLCKWRKGLSVSNIVFTHSPFWVQIWGLPFEHMSLEVGKELGNSLGKFIESYRRTGHSDQEKFMRIHMDLQLDKPLRRGGRVANADGDRFLVSFKSTSSEVAKKDDMRMEWKTTHTTAKNSSASVKEGGNGSIVGGSINGPGKTGERDGGSIERTNAVRSEKKQFEETLRDRDYPARVGCTNSSNSTARVESFTPQTVPSNDLGLTKINEDAYSLVGQKIQEEKEFMEVSSPIKPTP
ncbi:hypothetical protein SO802_007340 [Lithocarpus litseifolius]|uniref:DUF4283 domain-containing protein n=1 Tax=Lithocarpus litseifolius TaxID=425828 RepID=A0AAW2DNB4_9ROSI